MPIEDLNCLEFNVQKGKDLLLLPSFPNKNRLHLSLDYFTTFWTSLLVWKCTRRQKNQIFQIWLYGPTPGLTKRVSWSPFDHKTVFQNSDDTTRWILLGLLTWLKLFGKSLHTTFENSSVRNSIYPHCWLLYIMSQIEHIFSCPRKVQVWKSATKCLFIPICPSKLKHGPKLLI